jgi:signal transduction histidine kinase
MRSLKEWLTPTRTLLLLLFLLTLGSISTLALFGFRLLDQQRMVDAQQSQQRLEQAADRIAVMARGSLADASERLEAGVLNPGELLFRLSPTSLDATTPRKLLYYPFPAPDPEPHFKLFEEAELFEFSESEPAEALPTLLRLSKSRDASIRAASLLRVARVLRALGRLTDSIATYRELAALDANVAGIPAGLLAKHAICELTKNPRDLSELGDDLSSGRWRLTRGQFEFYWSEAGRLSGSTRSLPADKTRMTEIADFVWKDRMNHPEPRGHETIWIAGAPVLLIWRGLPELRSILVARPDTFVHGNQLPAGAHYAFVDAEGRTVAGQKNGSARSVVRTAAETALPWTLFVSETKPDVEQGLDALQRFLLLVLAVMMLFLVLGTYFIARAIRREAEVQRMQSHFVSSVSHEFRSPLTSMRQLSEMLAEGRVASESRRQMYYDMLVKETSRLQRLIEGLLNFGRMEAGARPYQFEELDAFTIVERVVNDFEAQATSLGKHIEIVRTSGACRIEADTEALSVALRNLLDNAVKYSPHGPTIWVECGSNRDKVAIRVRDEGLGIAESERKAIFRKFMRGGAATAANVKGSGVGLAMVSHIVEAHGGAITVASELGHGSTFTMLFPLAERS